MVYVVVLDLLQDIIDLVRYRLRSYKILILRNQFVELYAKRFAHMRWSRWKRPVEKLDR